MWTFSALVHCSDDSKSVNPVGCGRRPFAPANLHKIVGGRPAARGDWGWQVGLNWYNQQNSHFCGGVLINSEWVLTAGHCFDGYLICVLTNKNIKKIL